MNTPCEICGKPVPDYEPEYCCSGWQCGCMGVPIEPCVCSVECSNALFDHIGMPMDERRKVAGIELWVNPTDPQNP